MTAGGGVTYEALAVAIAQHVYRQHYTEEARIDLPPIHTFDTLCASYFQIPAGVLSKLNLLEPLDDIGRRWSFRVAPEAFEQTVRMHRANGCSFDTLVIAAMELVEQRRECQELLDLLATLGLCEPVTYRTRTVPAPPREISQYLVRELWRQIEVPDFEVVWTARKARFDRLRRDWVGLIL